MRMVKSECMELGEESRELTLTTSLILNKLDTKDTYQIQYELIKIKNLIIGNNNYKNIYLKDEIIIKFLELIVRLSNDYELVNEIVIIFASFAKGNIEHLRKLVQDYSLNEKLIGLLHSIDSNENCVHSSNAIRLIESCLCCLKNLYSIIHMSTTTSIECIYKQQTIKMLLKLFNLSKKTKEYIIELMSQTCLTRDSQCILISLNSIQLFSSLLKTTTPHIQLVTLKFYNSITYENHEACRLVMESNINDTISSLYLSRDKSLEIQLFAAKCLTNMARSGVLDYESNVIRLKTLSTLIRLCNKTQFHTQNAKRILVLSISTLCYLIEVNAQLQEVASYLEQIIPTLCYFILNTNHHVSIDRTCSSKSISNETTSNYMINANYEYLCVNLVEKDTHVELLNTRLCSISFYALALLSSQSEDVRRRVSTQEGLMIRLIESIKQTHNKLLRLSCLSLMHSLSRSVQQLRTKFLDHKVWMPIIDIIQQVEHEQTQQQQQQDDDDDHLLCLTTAIFANLLLEFSPSKETMIDYDIISLLVKCVDTKQMSIKVNALWALMNMSFQSEQKLKQQILTQLSMEKIFQLLTENSDENLLMKTLGLLRNLICTKSHIDQIMSIHGTKVIQAVIMILEGEYSHVIKEQALCILANVADGNISKEYIMGNEDLLRKLGSFMTSNCTQLQVASVFCLSNLVWSQDEGACERQLKLKEMGFQRLLQKLFNSSDPILFDKVKISLQQFS